MPAGQMPVDQLPVGQMSVGQMPVGQIPVGQLPAGQWPVRLLSLAKCRRPTVRRTDGFRSKDAEPKNFLRRRKIFVSDSRPKKI